MATTAQYRMADRLTGGSLADLLTKLRGQAVSYEGIARQLFADFGIEVTRQTVANWVAELEIEESSTSFCSQDVGEGRGVGIDKGEDGSVEAAS